MQWIAPSERDTANASFEKRLWDAADSFRANHRLKPQDYSGIILGIIFLRFAEVRYSKQRATLEKNQVLPVAAHVWTNLQRTLPRASFTSPPTCGLIID